MTVYKKPVLQASIIVSNITITYSFATTPKATFRRKTSFWTQQPHLIATLIRSPQSATITTKQPRAPRSKRPPAPVAKVRESQAVRCTRRTTRAKNPEPLQFQDVEDSDDDHDEENEDGSMVVYVTKGSDAKRLLREGYFFTSQGSQATREYLNDEQARSNVTTVKRSATRHSSARTPRNAQDVLAKAIVIANAPTPS
ncbi:uncharacterized protein A1O9_12967 [Exophiala aquamarina CBS 119918]|uniref:Uncharacterized protein n=1 Tax=Exophiala aquamarina CBS 119918 TaxID=1182545 RepID=A0A072P5U6_9EURO|nr:uncharacterized protein A1O9_12967 [Exophiala aquamarina CBS 119918]KEF50990.1 hypothetical protein A1O9_12967 [Exophiala aquamarina CBS 119918]